MKKFNAFTLAEVLVTLGIIGIVAALTMPSLIQNHKKKVVVEKLKKTSSALLQASTFATAEYGAERESFPAMNPDAALEMFNKYYVPYMKILKVEKGEKGVFGYLADGTVIYFIKSHLNETDCYGWACTYIAVCMDSKACEKIDENKIGQYNTPIADGKQIFGLYTNGQIPSWILKFYTHAQRIDACKRKTIEGCSSLIFEAGWKIPKDYPIKF